MSTTTTIFYREQAARHQAEANGQPLANVRARSQRAADAYAQLADRLEQTDALREGRHGRSNAPLDDPAMLADPSENPDRRHPSTDLAERP